MIRQEVKASLIFYISLLLLFLLLSQFSLPSYKVEYIKEPSENIAIGITSILVAASALFVSFTLMNWNQRIDSLFNYVKYVIDKIEYYKERKDQEKTFRLLNLAKDINLVKEQFESSKFWLVVLYWIVIILSIFIMFTLLITRFLTHCGSMTCSNFQLAIDISITTTLVIVISVLIAACLIALSIAPSRDLQLQNKLNEIILGITSETEVVSKNCTSKDEEKE